MSQIRHENAYSNLRNNYCFEKKKIVENNLSMCQLDKKDNEINAYLSKTVPNCLTYCISQYVRYVSRYQECSNTNKIFAKEKLLNFLKSLNVFKITIYNYYAQKEKVKI